jgi:hypothetical protein
MTSRVFAFNASACEPTPAKPASAAKVSAHRGAGRLIVISSPFRTVLSRFEKRLQGGDMQRRVTPIAAGLAALALLTVGAIVLGTDRTKSTSAQAASPPIRLADARMIVEVNATDGDAGLQVFLDGEAWRSMTISGPDGRTMLAVNGEGRLRTSA